ncbi:unnamed protein product [Gulo gulo]|uniref:Olfactory receptor n=1 Tax=Gulo gulo TaxID=48420 RepID=A0A9X9LNR1_GULGU|nr:unnamed protein product [Gulo gulo]
MIPKVCVYWLTGTCLHGLENSVTHSVLAVMFTLCGLNQIRHFLCDIPLFPELSYSDIFLNESVFHVISITTGLKPCLFIAMSYLLIISAMLRSPSGQKQGLYLGIYFTVVVTLFGTADFNNDNPKQATTQMWISSFLCFSVL